MRRNLIYERKCFALQVAVNAGFHPHYYMQELIILLIFAAALTYLGRRAYRSFSKKQTGCGKGCGCETDTKTIRLH